MMKRKHTIILAGAISGVALVLAWATLGGESSASMSSAEAACERWIGDAFDSQNETTVFGSWKKRGKIVVDVGYNPQGSNYSTRICVYDPKTGDLVAPNAFQQSQWMK